MSIPSARAFHPSGSKPAPFDLTKALVWLVLAAVPWLALYLIGRHIL